MAKTFDLEKQIDEDTVEVPIKLADGTARKFRSRPLLSGVLASLDPIEEKGNKDLERFDYPELAADRALLADNKNVTVKRKDRLAAEKRVRDRDNARGKVLLDVTFSRLAAILVDEEGNAPEKDFLLANLPPKYAMKLESEILFPDGVAADAEGNDDRSEEPADDPTGITS